MTMHLFSLRLHCHPLMSFPSPNLQQKAERNLFSFEQSSHTFLRERKYFLLKTFFENRILD